MTVIKQGHYTIKIKPESADTYYATVWLTQPLTPPTRVLMVRSYKTHRSAEQACIQFINKQLKGI